jgi:DNA repair protein RadC
MKKIDANTLEILKGCQVEAWGEIWRLLGVPSQLERQDYDQFTLALQHLRVWHRMRNLSVEQLTRIDGISPIRAQRILAALTLGKRVHCVRPHAVKISSSEEASNLLMAEMGFADVEMFALIYLNYKNRVMGREIVSIGSTTECIADPQVIFRRTFAQNVRKIIVAHNHPSGDVEPSQLDLDLTATLLQGANILNIIILDHIILGGNDFRSLRQTTNLWRENHHEND